jgi:ribosome recycling factor
LTDKNDQTFGVHNNPYSFLDEIREKEIDDLKSEYKSKDIEMDEKKEIQRKISRLVNNYLLFLRLTLL